MGLNISDIIPRKSIGFEDLKNKIVAVDAFNAIYQFLSTIRQKDGTPLMDKKGNITSHLSGLFYRNLYLLQEGIKLVYVFDGKPPELKRKTNEKRQEIKEIAKEKYEEAILSEDYEAMRRYSQQLVKIDEKIIEESKELLEAMSIAVIQAPSEGESQAAYLCKIGKVYAVASQDYDSLLFQSPRLIQNLTLARTRKTVSGVIYISPEIISLENVLNTLQINLDQLICLGILVGTDYNPGGIRGIGQKKALEIVKKYKQPYLIFNHLKKDIEKLPDDKKFDWEEIFQLFHKPEVKDFEIIFPKFDENKIKKILLSRDFSEERINNALLRYYEEKKKSQQKTLF
ncbi:MAG: flap endonuclease-1 [Candidatus Pacearchaeota archaeon]